MFLLKNRDMEKERAGKPSRRKELSLIIPTYNEAENIPELLERIEASLKGFGAEVVFVDDNSQDGTASLAEKLGEHYGNVKVLRRPFKMGLGSAVLDGMRIAEADIVAVMDADLQHPPELLPKMLEKLKQGYGLVVASRYVEGGGIDGWSLRRKLVSRCATKLTHTLLPDTKKVKDPMSGFFMLQRSVVENTRLNPTGYKILLEILAKANPGPVAEVPYAFKTRRRGRSKLSFWEIVSYLIFILRLKSKST
ncbi:MAG: polyprenol monophosphomannose synthase [Candidatus Brockarchaeota archaeon]|nr:polyprenol monophosphomannose synthase [Candidatus Brockarchaeota archaeon]